MSKRWSIHDDIFLARHHDVGANFVASHDLHFTGKNAGEARLKKLKLTGVWDKLIALIEAQDDLSRTWIRKLGRVSDIDLIDAADGE